MSTISIAGLDKATLLAALFNAAHQQGLGTFDITGKARMSVAEAGALLRLNAQFDYLKGRVLKISLADADMDTRLYDRDNGHMAAELVVAALRSASTSTCTVLD